MALDDPRPEDAKARRDRRLVANFDVLNQVPCVSHEMFALTDWLTTNGWIIKRDE